jgi:hypothetical protein
MRALEKDPSLRFPDAPSFAAALRALNPATLNVATNEDVDDAVPLVTRTEADRTPPRGVRGGDRRLAGPRNEPARRAGDTGLTTTVASAEGRSTRGSGENTSVTKVSSPDPKNGVGPAPTRATSSEAVGADRSERSKGSKGLRRLLLVFVPLLGAVGGAVLGVEKANQDHPKTLPIGYLRAQSFELDADGEHENQLPFLNDGNKATTWSTSTYPSRNFVRGKPGVGVVMVLEQAQTVRTVTLTTPSNGWNAQVYVSDRLPTDLDGWGEQRGSKVNIGSSSSTIDIQPTKGTYVLLWITDLGPKTGPFAQVKIAELGLRG